MGTEGAKFLAENIKDMKGLNSLDLSDNEIGDLGVTLILNALKSYKKGDIDDIDLSGNGIGKTALRNDCGEAFYNFLHENE
jgi:hypothetical protein